MSLAMRNATLIRKCLQCARFTRSTLFSDSFPYLHPFILLLLLPRAEPRRHLDLPRPQQTPQTLTAITTEGHSPRIMVRTHPSLHIRFRPSVCPRNKSNRTRMRPTYRLTLLHPKGFDSLHLYPMTLV